MLQKFKKGYARLKSIKQLLVLLLLAASYQVKAQCFEIESILVDACDGSQEGQNEMVIFKVGTTALNAANLNVSWPNNSWLGLSQNATTASAVAGINATILSCGFLKEPAGGVLPPNSKVLLITSTAFNTIAQSFANLTDTLIVLFQTAGNTAGHFANYAAGGGVRTLSLSFPPALGCSDAVTYDRALLVNQAGIVGAQDGGAVEFTPSGQPTYVNHGCQAPFVPLTVDAGPDKLVCRNSPQTFTAIASGNYSSVLWSTGAGATGSFNPGNSLITAYTMGAGDNGMVKLYCTILKSCGTQTISVKDSVTLTVIPLPTATVSPSVVTICPGQSTILHANSNASATYTWSTGANTSIIQVNSTGTYTVNVSNSCGTAMSTATVNTSSAAPSVAIVSTSNLLCPAQTTTLSLAGSTGACSWSNGATTATTTVANAGVYSVTVTSSCGQATASLQIAALPTPAASVSPLFATLCPGASATLTVTSNTSNYLWNTGAITNTISASTSGVYSVTVANQCGTRTATANIGALIFDPIFITSSSNTLCANETATLNVSGGTLQGIGIPVEYTWLYLVLIDRI